MNVRILVWFASVVVVTNSSSSSLINYYVDLITREQERAFTTPIVFNAYEHSPETKKFTDYGTFDHIIIGAGTSGSVIANRLSENTSKNILLLEAGGNESNFSNIPSMALYLQGLEYNWNYFSTPQLTSCLGMIQQQCYYPRGKGLGGTTILNNLIYTRGYRRDYDKWFAQGNVGWSYKDLLPYFEKLETPSKKQNALFNLEYQEPLSLQTKIFFEANRELGVNLISYNTDDKVGIFRPKFAKIKGQRLSTGRAFLQPVLRRKNLKISRNSFVVKILVNEQKRAYGVIFTKNGHLYVAKSREDVILSAGVFGSPQILLLSGIGPRFHLEQLGIPVIKNLPVGNNLEDHTVYASLEFTSNYTEPYRTLRENIQDYLNNFGPFTNAWNEQAMAFLQTKYSKIADYPDIALSFIPSNNTNDFFSEAFNYDQDTFDVVTKDSDPQRSFTIFVSLLRPKSKGFFRLDTVNPFEYPKIDPRFLSDPDNKDIETLYQGIQFVLKLANTTSFASIGAKLKDQTFPYCRRYKYLSKQYWYCQLRQIGTSLFHPVGTCKMGTSPEKGAVVNPELRVFGIKNLRIADASVFPTQISAPPMATAIVVGEKLANFIKSTSTFNGY
ncbi:hypothetical protein RN001_004161 [Aquatica leii]|uniref:Glucose-methanol-choline oxidoreductase N-terminal domain-containing protein n=1 Tax=Aquatica leii TaxID=1421715 RepID=A0AAN7PH50_9COLE|nr:hypothetical protein RN001_004161 [Aquatica leii]